MAHFAKKLPNDLKLISIHCLTNLSFDVMSNRVFWEEYKHVIVLKFNERQSNVGYTMRNEWMSKCVWCVKRCVL